MKWSRNVRDYLENIGLKTIYDGRPPKDRLRRLPRKTKKEAKKEIKYLCSVNTF
jgi:hypothetical protein